MVSKRIHIFSILIFVFTVVVVGQGSQVNDENNEKLKTDILALFKTKGEEGLRNFVKKHIDEISNQFILDFAESGVKKRKEEWLSICKVIAEEKKDQKAIADVYLKLGEYFRLVPDYNKSGNHFDKALPIYVKINDLGGQGNVYWSKGNISFYMGDKSTALKMYDKALPFFEKAGDFRGQGFVYWGKGMIYYYLGDNEKATELYDKAIPFFEKASYSEGLGNVYHSKGNIYLRIGENTKAHQMYDRALSCFEKEEEPLTQGNIYFSKGTIYLYTGNFSSAHQMYDKALVFFKKAEVILNQANVYFRKGNIYLYSGDFSSALKMFDKALLIYEKTGVPQGQANIYYSKGNIYLQKGDYPSALEMYDKAFTLYEKIKAPLGQGHVYWRKGGIYFNTGENSRALEMYDKALIYYKKANEPIGLGNVYRNKGDIYFRTGDNLNAFKMYDKALPFYEKAEDPVDQGNIYLSKGEIFLRVGENSSAIEMCNKSLPYFEKGENLPGQGNVYLLKGEAYLRAGDISTASEMYDKALSFYRKTENLLGQGNVRMGKASICVLTGNNPGALELYDNALQYFEKLGDTRALGTVYQEKGSIYFRNGDNLKSLEMYDNALFLFKKCEDIESEAGTLYSKSKVIAKMGGKNGALVLFEKAIKNLERVRFQTAFPKMKKTFMEKVYDQYEETVMFMLENKYYDKGLKYAESMRSRVFLDRMAEGLVKLNKGLMPGLKENRDKLVAKLSLLSEEMHKTAGEENEKKLKELKEQYHKIEGEFEELLIKIRLNNPLYAAVRYPQPVSVKDLQENVLETDELLLRYFISPDNVYVFLVSKKDFNVITLGIKEEDMNEIVSEYLFSVLEKKSRRVRKYGRQLYRQLFKPLESFIKQRKEIVIIPDGQLVKIPFESLVIDEEMSRKPVYLLEKYRVKYIQSASVLAILRKHYQRYGSTKRFIGFGDPVYDYDNFEKGKPEIGTPSTLNQDAIRGIHRGRYEHEGGIFTRLTSSGEEVNTIANLFKSQSQKCAVHLRQEANEANAKSPDLKEFDYIHFACHAVLGDGFQSLVLSQLPQSTEDGYLTLNEIMNCDYNAKLVVLSACQTGKGKMEKGEGVTGLTQAVMYAGTPAVVASLWNVEDIAARELMVKFYKYLLEENVSKEDALRKAKLDLIKTGRYASPFFWSAFVMYGE
jgi:CHAT domain-containing protein/predicted negative regulator of RcsB-dependent stress response